MLTDLGAYFIIGTGDTETYLTHRNALQYIAIHCNTLQHTAIRYNTLQHAVTMTLKTHGKSKCFFCEYVCAWGGEGGL